MLTAREQNRVRTLRTRIARGTATTAEVLEFHALVEKGLVETSVRAPAGFKPRTRLDFQPRPDELEEVASWLDR